MAQTPSQPVSHAPRVLLCGTDSAGVETPFLAERVTDGFPVITTDHALIHEGKAFTVAGTMAILNNKTGALMFATPATGYIHFKAASIASDVAVTVSFMEGYEEGVGDTVSVITPPNRNRLSATAATAVVKGGTDVTPIASGAQVTLITARVGANQPAYKVGGAISPAEEWVLAQGRDYIVAIANASGSTANVSYDLFWYEEAGA